MPATLIIIVAEDARDDILHCRYTERSSFCHALLFTAACAFQSKKIRLGCQHNDCIWHCASVLERLARHTVGAASSKIWLQSRSEMCAKCSAATSYCACKIALVNHEENLEWPRLLR